MSNTLYRIFILKYDDIFLTHLLDLFSDLIQKPKIQFLEFHMPIQSLLIQLMSEEIDEPVDAIIRFSLVSSSKSRNKLGSQEYISGI